MTPNEAKRDYAARLRKAGVKFDRLTARTTSFSGLGYGSAVFVEVHGAHFPKGTSARTFREGVPKPSEGGYVAQEGRGCTWENDTVLEAVARTGFRT